VLKSNDEYVTPPRSCRFKRAQSGAYDSARCLQLCHDGRLPVSAIHIARSTTIHSVTEQKPAALEYWSSSRKACRNSQPLHARQCGSVHFCQTPITCFCCQPLASEMVAPPCLLCVHHSCSNFSCCCRGRFIAALPCPTCATLYSKCIVLQMLQGIRCPE
jgi:hypothetical protein